jgi:hypothetical protein
MLCFPVSLPLALIEWQDLSRGFHGGFLQSETIAIQEEEGEPIGIEIAVKEYTSDSEDYFGVSCPAWEVLVTIYDELSPSGRSYHCGDDFTSSDNAREYAAYIVWQFRKGHRLSCVPSQLID